MLNSVATASREGILGLFNGHRPARRPCFSGLMNVTLPGLENEGLRFGEVHTNPRKMAAAAASTHRLFGFESAVVPLDLCVEASALGAAVDFREQAPRPEFPIVAQPLAATPGEFDLKIPPDFIEHERITTVIEAIRILKEQVGCEPQSDLPQRAAVPFAVVGAWVPGPVTLAMQLIEIRNLTASMAREPEVVTRLLEPLTDVIIQVGMAYRAAGADFITIHEMGGSPGFVGPPVFKKLILPQLQRMIAALPRPLVLSVCGNTNRAMPLLAECGADALSVDQANDLARSRETLGPNTLLFGNIDPIGTLANGTEVDVREAVRRAIEAGVDAVWPGCDLWPLVPAANMYALVDEVRNYSGVPR